ncbi:MAG: hypothetical protein Q8R88_13195, partial [Desulfoprunum sp.]|nr:hypothetical protein [Desulfoprunum sp.]
MRKTGICVKLFAIVLALFMVAPVQAISAPAGAVKIEINHKPSQEKYIPGFRIQLDTTIENDKGFLATRCYFKAKNDKVFTFVNMRNIKGNEYSAILPAPWVKSEFIEYLFVAVDMDKVVTRTQLFKVEEKETQEAGVWKDVGEVKEIRVDQVQEVVEEKEILRKQIREKYSSKRPPYQIDPQGVIVVSTELDKALYLNGFYDGINLFKVPAAARFGVLAEKLYTPEQIAEAGG